MFNVGERVKMNTYNKNLNIFVTIIEKKMIKDRIAYVVLFRSGKIGTYFENEILKCE